MHVLSMIALGAVAVVAIGWIVVSFLAPTQGRRRVEWLAATALYVALFSFFVNLVRRSIADDATVGIVAFGFLATIFGMGLLLSVWRLIGALGGRAGAGEASATN